MDIIREAVFTSGCANTLYFSELWGCSVPFSSSKVWHVAIATTHPSVDIERSRRIEVYHMSTRHLPKDIAEKVPVSCTILNQLMRDDFKRRVVTHALEHIAEVSDESRKRLDRSISRIFRVPGFQSAAKAPRNILLPAIIRRPTFPEVFLTAILNVWCETQEELRATVTQFLTANHIELVGGVTTSGKFERTWASAYLKELADEFVSTHPGIDVDDVSLMICLLASSVPFPGSDNPDNTGHPASKGMEEPAVDPICRSILDTLESVPPDSDTWDHLDRLFNEIRIIARQKALLRSMRSDEIRSAIDAVQRSHADEFEYFELEGWETWSTDNCQCEAAQQICSSLAELLELLSTHQQLRLQKSTTAREDAERIDNLRIAEERLRSVFLHLNVALTPQPGPSHAGSSGQSGQASQTDEDCGSGPASQGLKQETEGDPSTIEARPKSAKAVRSKIAAPIDEPGDDRVATELPTACDETPGPCGKADELPETGSCEDRAREGGPSAQPDQSTDSDDQPRPLESEPSEPADSCHLQVPDRDVCIPSTWPTCMELAGAALATTGQDRCTTIERLTWRLLGDGELALAYHLAHTVEQQPDFGRIPPSWLLSSCLVGASIGDDTGDAARVLREALGNFTEEQCFAPADAEWNHAIRFLLAAACLRPSILAPSSTAPALVREIRLKDGLNETYEYLQAISKYGLYGRALSLKALSLAHGEAAWRAELDELLSEVNLWVKQNRNADFGYVPATDVWRTWMSTDSTIGSVIGRITASDWHGTDEVRTDAARLRDDGEVKRLVAKADREIRGDRLGGNIAARALSLIIRHVKEAVFFVDRWLELSDMRPDSSKDFFQREADKLRQLVLESRNLVLTEVTKFETDKGSPLICCAARCFKEAVEDVSSLFSPGIAAAKAPSVRMVTNQVLLKLSGVSLDRQWEPTSVDPSTLLDLILQGIQRGDVTWEEAFEARLAQLDFVAAGLIIDYLEVSEGTSITTESLRGKRDQSIREHREVLGVAIQKTAQVVENAVSLGLLTERDRDGYSKQIQSLDASIDHTLSFRTARECLDRISTQIEHYKQQQAENLTKRLNSLVDASHPYYSRIVDMIEQSDVLAANEYIDMVRAGEAIPEPKHNKDPFSEFCGLLPQLEDSLQPNSQLEDSPRPNSIKTNQIVEKMRRGHKIGPLNMNRVRGQEQELERAASMMGAWLTCKMSQEILRSHANTIFSGLGFKVKDLDVDVQGAPNRAWIDLVTEPVADRNMCPIAHYGSESNGRYRVLCLWRVPSEEDIVNDVGDAPRGAPVIVLNFGRLSEKRRRDLGRLCRERRRSFVVIDDLVILFLCSQPEPRLKLLFECVLPWTLVEPYTTTAGLVSPEMFYGRKAERKSIADEHGACFIYGGRQLGKTALLRQVERDATATEDGRLAVWLDLKSEGLGFDRPADEIWRCIGAELRKRDVLPLSFQLGVQPDKLMNAIVNWLDTDKSRRLLFLLDEADRFLECDGHDEYTRSSRLKGLMDRTNRRFKVVFAGLHNVQRTTEQANHPLAHYGTPVCVGPLLENGEWREARALIERPLALAGYEFESDELVARVLSKTNYYPNLIQLFCSELLRYCQDAATTYLDQQATGRYRISAQMVDRVLRSEKLTESIRHLFRLTLQLDQRYEVVAYTVAYSTLMGDGDQIVKGFVASDIHDEVVDWWPDGFRGLTESQFRYLLDEMVGLGVLRGDEGRYSLRSPNVVKLLGTEDEIESILLQSREIPPVFEPAALRSNLRVIGKSHEIRPSPITAHQESLIWTRKSGIVVLVGAEATGIHDLSACLEARAEDGHFLTMPQVLDKGSFLSGLREATSKLKEGVSVLLVTEHCPWTLQWVQEASKLIHKQRLKTVYIRLILLADPLIAWQMSQEDQAWQEAVDNGVCDLMGLELWHEAAVHKWMEDSGLPADKVTRGEVTETTGNWPLLVSDFRGRIGNDIASWDTHLQSLQHSLADSDYADNILRKMGVETPEQRRILYALALLGPTHLDELAELDDAPKDLVGAVLRWAELMNLAVPSGGGLWRIEPVAGQMLAKIEERTKSVG